MNATAVELVSHVAAHAGVSEVTAERILHEVLGGIGGMLSRADRTFFEEELPAPLAAVVERGGSVAQPLEERVLPYARSAGHARELVASVCHVLAEELSTEALDLVRATLPPTVRDFATPTAPEREHAATDRRRGLAGGHFGSEHPLDEARVDRAHADSVAAGNPHADSKLSSARGTTQERLHETIAEGAPKRRPIT